MRTEGGPAGIVPRETNLEPTRNWLGGALGVLRRVCGMPDYQAYVGHLRQYHPEAPIPTEREFFTQYTESRYGAGTSRCC